MSEQRIGKYVIQGELGRGAMGVVYKAVDPVIGRTVAVKTVRFDLLSDPGSREEAQRRFEREAQSAGSLSHPNIVTIYDIGEANGTTYIAMEFIEGQSLESLLAAGVRWDAVNAARFALQLAEALDLAHRKGIVHRDIKPGNILVDHEGRPHIVDFGIARISNSQMTQTNMVMGSPYYMSPEQIAGRKVDHRADIFALGAVLYEMLTREKAFPGDTLTTVIYKIINENPAPVFTIRGDIPAGISRIVEKALAKDIGARYGSCREMAADLRPFLSGQAPVEPDSAVRPAAVPARKKARVRRTREQPAEPGPALPLGGETMYAPAAREDGRSAGPGDVSAAEPASGGRAVEGRRKKLLLIVGLMMALIVAAAGVFYFTFKKPAPNIVPPAGNFSVVFAEKAVAETPVKEADRTTAGEADLTGRRNDSETAAGTGTVTGPPLEGMKTAPPPKPAAELKTEETPAAKKPPTEAGAKDKPSETVRPAENPATVAAKDTPVKTEASPTKGVTRLPRLHKQVDPVYPEDALREGIDGDVILNLSVGFDGRVERAAVVKSIPKLDAAAVAAARQWEFEPGLLEGIPIQATLQVTIHFGLPPGTVRTKGGNEEVKTEIPVRNTKKPAENPPPAPQDDLSRGRSLLERGARVEALALARKILASNPNQDEAKALAMDAVIQLAPGEIKSLVDEYAASTKAGRTVEFFRRHARSDVFNRLRDDLEAMANAVRDIQVTVSDLNLEFQTARYPDFQTRAVFSQVMTGIPSAKLYREVLFEGRYAWVLERRENDWVIVSVGVE